MAKLFDVFGSGSGRKFYMRDFRNAYKFRPNVSPVRHKFQGYVNFIINRSILNQLGGLEDGGQAFRTQISSLVRTADLPGVEFKTDTLNSFNNKKIVQTGITYTPVTMSVYDTVGNEWMSLLMKYFSYHYMNPRNKQQGTTDRDIASKSTTGFEDGLRQQEDFASSFEGHTFDSNRAGYNLNRISNFFERIDYVLYHGNRGVQYSIINPVLTSFTNTPLDYSDSQFREFNLNFEYEAFTTFNVTNFALSDADIDRFEDASGFSGPAFEPAFEWTGEQGASKEKKLTTLGETDGNKNTRSFQPQPSDQPLSGVNESFGDPITDADSLDAFLNKDPGTDNVTDTVNKDNNPAAIKATYGSAATFGDKSFVDSDPGLFDILGDVADNALVAAIHGGDIRDAALRTAVGGITSAVGTRLNNSLTGNNGDGG